MICVPGPLAFQCATLKCWEWPGLWGYDTYRLISSKSLVRSLAVFMAIDSTAPYRRELDTLYKVINISKQWLTSVIMENMVVMRMLTVWTLMEAMNVSVLVHFIVPLCGHNTRIMQAIDWHTWNTRKFLALIRIPIASRRAWYCAGVTTLEKSYMCNTTRITQYTFTEERQTVQYQ